MNSKLAYRIRTRHQARFGAEPALAAYAPGRAEVLGNHTDYNLGTVLSTAIDLGVVFTITPNNSGLLRIHAADLGADFECPVAVLEPAEDGAPAAPLPDWHNYVVGVATYLVREAGLELRGADCCFGGDLPRGSGLSSSAALEVAASLAFEAAGGVSIDPVTRARLCQMAEHNFVGTKSGLLDQFSSIFGRESHLIHLDFRSLEVQAVAVPRDLRFVLVTPGITHELASSPYNERRDACEEAAARLGALAGEQGAESSAADSTWHLRDFTPEVFDRYRAKLPEEAARRAAHVIGEIARVEAGRAALERGDLPAFGKLMTESHLSSRYNFENSLPELDEAVELCLKAGALGARLTGGGWGGSVIALSLAAGVPALLSELEARYNKLRCGVVVPSAGARLL